MRWGVMIIGLHGASASTLVAGYLASQRTSLPFSKGSYWCTLAGGYPEAVQHLSWGGWDYRFKSFASAVVSNGLIKSELGDEAPTTFPAVVGPSDYAVLVEGGFPTHGFLDQAVETVRQNIREFSATHRLDRVIVVNCSSPMYCGQERVGWSSVTAYALGAITEGADWVEFTPSDSVSDELVDKAISTGSRIAGRDGSTGQTVLKLALRDFLWARGFSIESWYSTNLIGNRDGLVLSHPDYRNTKMRDKRIPLGGEHGNDPTHSVSIEFVPQAGDNKEAWDCIHFSGWLNTPMSMRINWWGADSFLAAPLLLDIFSGLIHADSLGSAPGILKEVAVFFKAPLGCDGYRFQELYDRLEHFIASQPGA